MKSMGQKKLTWETSVYNKFEQILHIIPVHLYLVKKKFRGFYKVLYKLPLMYRSVIVVSPWSVDDLAVLNRSPLPEDHTSRKHLKRSMYFRHLFLYSPWKKIWLCISVTDLNLQYQRICFVPSLVEFLVEIVSDISLSILGGKQDEYVKGLRRLQSERLTQVSVRQCILFLFFKLFNTVT